MNPELKELISAFDAGVARLCEIIDRAEARFAAMEPAPADPLADHPELPLAAEPDEVETRWAVVEPEQEDPTRRVLPWGMLPQPPQAPPGYVWVNRGTYSEEESEWIDADGRKVRYLDPTLGWKETVSFGSRFHHIELIDATL